MYKHDNSIINKIATFSTCKENSITLPNFLCLSQILFVFSFFCNEENTYCQTRYDKSFEILFR